MNKYRLIIVLSFCMAIMLAISCGGNKQEKSAEQGVASVIEVKIEGMTCTACEQTIQRKVGKLEGIKSVTATFTDGKAVIEYYPGKVDTLKIKDAITGSGYVVKKFTPTNP
jgi:mercuric ion transport protein